MKPFHQPKLELVAMRALRRRGDVDHPINALGLGPLPGRMAFGRATLFRWAWRSGPAGWRLGRAALELTLVQSVELSLELLVLLFQLTMLLPSLVKLLAQCLQLVLVVALQPKALLVAFPNPFGREALQIGTPMPVRADKIRIQSGEARHGKVAICRGAI